MHRNAHRHALAEQRSHPVQIPAQEQRERCHVERLSVISVNCTWQDPDAAHDGLAALGRRKALPLGRNMSVVGGNSEVSALRELFAVDPFQTWQAQMTRREFMRRLHQAFALWYAGPSQGCPLQSSV
jgi:hypothetical protein